MQRYSNQVRVNSGVAPPVVDLGAPVATPTISVFDEGTANLSTIFSTNLATPTPLANPFTGSATGFFFFYARGGAQRYDVQVSLGTPAIATPYVIAGDVLLDQLNRIWIPASGFTLQSGTPVLAIQGANARYAAWACDAAADEGVAADDLVTLSYDIGVLTARVHWANLGAGAGDVVWRVRALGIGTGVTDLNTTAGEVSASDTVTAAAQNILTISLSTLVFTPSLVNYLLRFTVERLGTDGSDSLANDAGFVGLELRYP